MLRSHARGRPLDSHRNEILDPISANKIIDPKSRGRVKFIRPLDAAKWRTRGNTDKCQRIVNGLVLFYALSDAVSLKRQVEAVRDADPSMREDYENFLQSREEIKEEVFKYQPPPPRGTFRMFKRGPNLVWAVRQPATLPARLADMEAIGAVPLDVPPFPTDDETWTQWHKCLAKRNLTLSKPVRCDRKNGKRVWITTWSIMPMT
jgi:hypothetical protein